RYKPFNYRIGNLTEYYLFRDSSVADAVLNDLNQMQPKLLTLEEESVLAEGKMSGKQETGTLLLGVR
ncbi:MAG TPA: hypothetical protein VIQ31_10715, partial [Phormidium sp.]